MTRLISIPLRIAVCLACIVAAASPQQAQPKRAELIVRTGIESANTVVFSPDGRILAIGGTNVQLLTSSGEELRTLTGHIGYVSSVAFSPDGKTLASGGAYNLLNLTDVASGKVLKLEGHTETVSAVAFSPDGKVLASGSWDKSIKLWDMATGKEIRTLNGHEDAVTSLAFSPDGKILASGSWDKTVKLWVTSTWQQSRTLTGHADKVATVCFSPDGRILATAGGNSTSFEDGKTLGSGSLDNSIRLWEVTSGNQLRVLNGHTYPVNSVAYSPDGTTLASGSQDKSIRIWDVSSGQQLRTFAGHSNDVLAVAFSPDGKTLASGSNGLKLWNVATGEQFRAVTPQIQSILVVAISPDGKMLASGNAGGTINIWDFASGQRVRQLKGHNEFTFSIAFSPDSKTLASAGDKTIKLWDVASGNVRFALVGHTEGVLTVAYSEDGKTLVSFGETIKLWDTQSGRLLESLENNPENNRRANQLAPTLPPETSLFQAVTEKFSARSAPLGIDVFDTKTGNELCTLIALDDNKWLVVTPDGFFDGSPAAWKQIIWRLDNNTFYFAPIEAFFSDYFRPGLLQEIHSGDIRKADVDISRKDIRQPSVSVTFTNDNLRSELTTEREVGVEIEVVEAPPDERRPNTASGAKDVRLFRNGSLVKLWPGDAFAMTSGCRQTTMKREGDRRTICQTRVRLVAGENELSAYAFNRENVKTNDVAITLTQTGSVKRPRILYVLAVGVGTYANPEYKLNYTVADALAFGSEIKVEQEKVGRYQRVEVTTLLDNRATKSNILLSLKKFSEIVQPEDGVIVYFSGHGTAQTDHFYLIPHDLGYMGSRAQLNASAVQTVVSHSISDVELEEAFRGIDAGQLLLVIDACNSGQALQAEDWRRGPMNTKGLAQLAYEKGMYVLTASQSIELAYESEALKHSYMTYALVEEGLKSKVKEADANNDGQVWLREWFDYVVQRVPRMREQMIEQTAKQQNKSLDVVEVAEQGKIQTPRVFYRREPDAQPWVVAQVVRDK